MTNAIAEASFFTAANWRDEETTVQERNSE